MGSSAPGLAVLVPAIVCTALLPCTTVALARTRDLNVPSRFWVGGPPGGGDKEGGDSGGVRDANEVVIDVAHSTD